MARDFSLSLNCAHLKVSLFGKTSVLSEIICKTFDGIFSNSEVTQDTFEAKSSILILLSHSPWKILSTIEQLKSIVWLLLEEIKWSCFLSSNKCVVHNILSDYIYYTMYVSAAIIF